MSMRPPNFALALSDGPRAIVDMLILAKARPLLNLLPGTHKRHSVMVIPGFMGDDRGNGPLIRFLRQKGYIARGWGQGANRGPENLADEQLESAVEQLAEKGGGKVSLIGHSLGGIYAREMARTMPDAVHQVISIGSPFGQVGAGASHAAKLYYRLNPNTDTDASAAAHLAVPPPVPTTAIYTRADGIVNWRATRQAGDDHEVHNIEVLGSHIGLNLNASVWFWIMKKLAEVDSRMD